MEKINDKKYEWKLYNSDDLEVFEKILDSLKIELQEYPEIILKLY
jgi:hypothetical protein